MKVRIEMEDFRARQAWLELLEATPLGSLEITDGGEPVALPEGLARAWKIIGLSNRDFLREADAYLSSGEGLRAMLEDLKLPRGAGEPPGAPDAGEGGEA